MAYKVNEMFWSPQGEGIRAGEMSLFIRLSGCNMKCAKEASDRSPGGFDCDTEFESGTRQTLEELLASAALVLGEHDVVPSAERPVWVVLTGGEPGLQVDRELVDALHRSHYYVAIESNGSIDLNDLGLDWVVISPKVAEHAVRCRTADEVRYVRGFGQALPKPACKATYKYISPAFDGLSLHRPSLQWCVDLIKKDPTWRLSVQQHKWWGVR